MIVYLRKGQHRIDADDARQKNGEPRANESRNRTPNCRFAKGGKATRKYGLNRFKTGRKHKH